MLDHWVEDATEGFLVAAQTVSDHPGDAETDAVFWDTLARLDLLLQVRSALRT